MKKQIPILFLIAINLLFFLQCEKQPTSPQFNNPLDPKNPATGGDPFNLQAQISGGGITLNWTLLDIQQIDHYCLYRKVDDDTVFQLIFVTDSNDVSTFTDILIQNGHLYTYYIIAVDNLGLQINSNYTQVEINSEPVLSIDDIGGYTASRSVNLTIIAFGASRILLDCPDLNNAQWQNFSSSNTLVLPSGPGPKIVCAQFVYENGDTSEITADTTAPLPMNPLIMINNDSLYAPLRDVELTLQAAGALWIRIANDSAFTLPASDNLFRWDTDEFLVGKSTSNISGAGDDWIPYVSDIAWQLSAGGGDKLVFVDFKNDFEIIETASDTILPLPIDAQFTIDHDSTYTLDREVWLYPLAQGIDIEFMCSEDENFTGSVWIPMPDSLSFQLPTGPGPKIIYARFKNDFGIIENAADDIEPIPMNPYFNINHNNIFTAAKDVWIFPQAQGVDLMCKYSEDSTFTGLDWADVTDSSAFELSMGNDLKTVYGKFINSFEIESAVVSDDIIPMPISIVLKIADGAEYINANVTDLSLNGAGILQMKLHTSPDSSAVSWLNYQSSYTNFNLSGGDGKKYVYGWFRNDFYAIGPQIDSVYVDTYCHIYQVECGQNAGDTLTAGDTLYLEMTMEDDSIGLETGGISAMSLAGVFENLILTDNLDGSYSTQYIIQSDDFCLNDTLYCNFTDRAGNTDSNVGGAFPWPVLTYWETALGTTADDEGYCAIPTQDNGYIICGTTYPYDFYVIKTDALGNEIWQNNYNLGGQEFAYSICPANDGGYLICGSTDNGLHPLLDVLIIKIDNDGSLIWSRSFGGSSNDVGYSIIQCNNGGYVIVGYTGSFGTGNTDFYLLKINEAGSEQWSRIFGASNYESGYQVIQTADGGFAIAGKSGSTSFGYVRLIKTDNQGNQLWARSFMGSLISCGYAIAQCSDGGYLLTGDTWSAASSSSDFCLVKTDASGNEIWSDTFGGTGEDIGYGVCQTSDGNYIIAGKLNDDVWLHKIDIIGTEIWTKTCGGSSLDYARSIGTSLDGGAIIGGTTESFGAGGSDFYLIKISPE